MKHNIKECNYYEWDALPSTFLKLKSGCLKCNLQKGEKHYNWQGGLTRLIKYFRRIIPIEWKKNSMEFCNYKCVITGNRFDDIHHLYGFASMLKEVLNELQLKYKYSLKTEDFTTEQLQEIENLLWIKHNKLFGVCLTIKTHELFHSLYTNKNNTPQQFKEFVKRLEMHEFDDYLKEHNLVLNINYNAINNIFDKQELSKNDSSFLIAKYNI